MTTEVEYRTRCDLCGEYTSDSVRVEVAYPETAKPTFDVCKSCQHRPIADLAAKATEGTGF